MTLPLTDNDIIRAIQEIAPNFVDIRRQIHANPEIAFKEFETSSLVSEKLASFGYEVHKGLGGTGVVGRLKKGNGQRSIGIRADMDALPIHEKTDLDYASKTPGLMHACGHDGHTAILLCAAQYLSTASFEGTLHLIFQPAEENEGGAIEMINDGLFERFPCDEIYALHNSPGQPVGTLAVAPGVCLASFDRATITLTGSSAHGAMPHYGIDPVQCAASIALGIQSIITREIDAFHPVVITTGSIQAGTVYNVVPSQATLKIGIRTLDPKVRLFVEKRIKEFVTSQAESYRLSADIVYEHKYPVLINHDEPVGFLRETAASLLGEENVVSRKPSMGSEDFAYMLEHVPGAYVRLGNGQEGNSGKMLHTDGYDFNDDALPIGAALWAQLAMDRLSGDA